MKIVKLSSGIGNQLFMYAFYIYIKNKYDDAVYFDDKYFKDKKRKSELSIVFPNYPVYKFSFNPAGEDKILYYLYRLKQTALPSFELVREKVYCDDVDYSGNVYFDGYWQTARYVDKLDKIMFTPREPMPKEILKYNDLIGHSTNPVSVHVRRGDYFEPIFINRFGVCNSDYYQRAVNKMDRRIADCNYFVFSDDIEWAKHNIDFPPETVFVTNYDINSFWYIYLMSHCHHNIISNSTFSWWGAYLNQYNDKIVMGPSIWRKDTNETLMLDNWEVIEV